MGRGDGVYRVLSLDGGGAWALLQATALAELYPSVDGRPGGRPGREILREFDLCTATSGGSIVLACLADDWTPGRIVEMFKSEEDRRAIFRPLQWSEREGGALPFLLRTMLSIPRYATEPKREHFRRVLRAGDLPLDAVAAEIGGGAS